VAHKGPRAGRSSRRTTGTVCAVREGTNSVVRAGQSTRRVDCAMTFAAAPPDLSFVIPATNENRWGDLLATLIATDPSPIACRLGIECDGVRREVVVPGHTARSSDRLDLLLLHRGREVAASEVKLLSDLGQQQLARYATAFPSVDVYRVLHLGRLPVNLHRAEPWKSLTWESVLDAYKRSHHPWVSTTAAAWIRELDCSYCRNRRREHGEAGRARPIDRLCTGTVDRPPSVATGWVHLLRELITRVVEIPPVSPVDRVTGAAGGKVAPGSTKPGWPAMSTGVGSRSSLASICGRGCQRYRCRSRASPRR
jgi:hypothetical protein